MKKLRSESNRTSRRGAMALAAGVFALMVLTNVSPTAAGEGGAFCPCYTAGMIDAALVTMHTDDELPGPDLVCEDDVGHNPSAVDTVLFVGTFDPEVTDGMQVFVEWKVTPPRALCEIGVERDTVVVEVDDQRSVGSEFVFSSAVTFPQALDCRREMKRSVTWRRFCAD